MIEMSRSLAESWCPSWQPNLVPSVNLLMLDSVVSSRSSIKILNKTRPNPDPWGTPLVTDYQQDVALFTTTLWAQQILNPAKSAPVQTMGCQFCQEDAVRYSAKGFAKVQINYLQSLSLIHLAGHLVKKGHQVV
ncbi:hypothetical protein DUI87_16854 [Hirundo rustica rustica]|uniref:Uncharacterized protein n=1 Tax=Hirundo rustica rustica TaxID=333673 RepID=A0A3M0K254_HIRRU|nr:hypothetical protein DUI87_16854 [Hirundo rustica rustica]